MEIYPSMREPCPELSPNNNSPRNDISAVQIQDNCFLNPFDADTGVREDNAPTIFQPVQDEFVTQNDSWTLDPPLYRTPNTPNAIHQSTLRLGLQEINDLLGLAPVPYLSCKVFSGALTKLEPSRDIPEPEEKATAATSRDQDRGPTHASELSAETNILEKPPASRNQHQSPVEMRMRQPSGRITRRVEI
jgi:hypothetical protein